MVSAMALPLLRLDEVKIQPSPKPTKKAPLGGLNYSFVFGLRGPRIRSGATFF
jgi:hypothetical protein